MSPCGDGFGIITATPPGSFCWAVFLVGMSCGNGVGWGEEMGLSLFAKILMILSKNSLTLRFWYGIMWVLVRGGNVLMCVVDADFCWCWGWSEG
ncbi:MAG: hypothetical protein FWH05_07210 [Oscillospiraceae bacterium]|nr:hypothetical protein [Oscillospiraceae bacterium]